MSGYSSSGLTSLDRIKNVLEYNENNSLTA